MTDDAAIDLSLVCPVHNQADHVVSVIQSYIDTLKPITPNFEIIPVVNASRDESEALIVEHFGGDARVQPIVTPTPGWGNAVIVGIEAARGKQICYTNSSRTTGDELASIINAHANSENTLTKAQREARRPWYRIVGSALYNLEGRVLFGIKVKDVNGTPKVMDRAGFEEIPLTERGDFVDLELLYRCTQRGVHIQNIPMPARDRLGGKSTTGMKTAIRLLTGAPVRRLRWPIKAQR